MSKVQQILLVEDDVNFGPMLKDYLELYDFEVLLCADGTEGLREFRQNDPAICILDIMMPQKDGFALAEDIRELDKDIPLIFLTAKSLKDDMLRGFQAGADDYLTKPFDSEVLLYKIRAILSRQPAPEEEQRYFQIGKYRYDAELRTLQLGQQEQSLSPKEGALLKYLAQNKNRLVSRSDVLKKVWRDDNYFTGRSMDVYLAKIRKYLKDDERVAIVNVHSEGFRLVDES